MQNISESEILVTAYVVGFCPRIPHKDCLRALKKALVNGSSKNISTKNLVKIVDFVVKKSYFNFSMIVQQPVSYIAVGTKFMITFCCIFMDRRDSEFLKSWLFNPLICCYMVFYYLDSCRGKTCRAMINSRGLILILVLPGL